MVMKRFTFLVLVLLFASFVNAQIQSNFETKVNKIDLLSSNNLETVIELRVNNYSFKEVETPNGIENILIAPDATTLQIKGAPNVPKFTATLVIPNNKKMQVEISDEEYIEIQDINIAPSKGIITRNINPNTVAYTYGEQYSNNEFFPKKLFSLDKPFIQRDIRGITVKINPFQYNPITRVLRVYTHLKVRVFTNGEIDNINIITQKSEKKQINDEFAQIYKRSFLNYGSSEKYTPIEEGHPGKMLIISDAGFMSAMQPFVDWKNQKGIATKIVDVATVGNTASAIKTYVQDYYSNNPEFCYLLLVGDASQVASDHSNGASGDSDNMYGYLAGDDHRIDIFVGRFSAETEADVTTQVDRTIHYEKDVTEAETWMQNALGIASNEDGGGGGDDSETDIQHIDNIKTDLNTYGYNNTYSVYQDAADADDISAHLNNDGVGVINYCGHGDTQMWFSVDPNGYTNNHVNQLTNDNHLPFIFSVACVAGDFVSHTCFGEAWQRATNSGNPTGAIAIIASTINQTWAAPMCAQDEMDDILVESYSNNIKRTFGGISANGWGQMIDEYNNDGENMADTWVCFGDPSVMVRTKKPASMTITHASSASGGATSFLVNCNEEGALVSITINNVIYGTEYASGGSANVSLSPALPSSGSILVTVTAYNRVTYQQEVPIGGVAPLECDFSGTPTTVNVGGSVTFTDLSAGNPTSWNWTFTGADVTSSNIQTPPAITYSTVGTYEVSLTCANADGSDTETKPAYITVVEEGSINCDFSGTPTTINVGSSVTFTDLSTESPTSWDWTFTGADVTSSNIQTPPAITYSNAGTYEVSLTCTNADGSDTETKPAYITVVDTNILVADFSGTPTTIAIGQSVDFTDLSNSPSGTITSWNWTFTGADVTTSTDQNPLGITYSTAGYYNVKLIVNDDASQTDTEEKVEYIHVLGEDETPKADFVASQTNIIPGDVINYTNLSTLPTMIDSSQWILESADVPNDNIYVSGAGNLANVMYNAAPGYYDATLVIFSSFGTDTMFKDDYIHILDTNNLADVHAIFRATTDRLIPQGSSVSFETIDEEIGDAQYFEWTFEGGNPATYTGQYPPEIFYSTPGYYDVALKVWNDAGSTDSLNKTQYVVVVSQWPYDEDGYCDDITNMLPGEMSHHARHLSAQANNWGYFPGHNYKKVKFYAEKFVNYTFNNVQDININNCRIYNASNNYNKVVFYIWDVDENTGMPGAVLGSKVQHISDFTQGVTFPAHFDPPVTVDESFYAGFKIQYPSATSGEPQDTFAVYYSGARPTGPNTVVCSTSSTGWKTPTEMMGEPLEISLDLTVKACLVKVDEIFNYADKIELYPNPTKGRITIDLGDMPFINPDLRVYDITGRLVSANYYHTYGNKYELDLSDNMSGIYMVTFDFGGTIVTKKVTLMK